MSFDIAALMQAVATPQGRAPIEAAAAANNLSPDQMNAAVQALLPALAADLSRKDDRGGADGLVEQVLNAGQSRNLDDLGDPRETGNALLGQLFGDRNVSRAVAADASARSGLGEDVLKQLLPVITASLVSQLAGRQQNSGGGGGLLGGLAGALGGQGGGLASLAGSFLGGASHQAAEGSDLSADVLRMIMNR